MVDEYYLTRPVNDFEWSRRAELLFAANSIVYVFELVQMTERELMKMDGCGVKTLNDIKNVLRCLDLDLGIVLSVHQKRRLRLEVIKWD